MASKPRITWKADQIVLLTKALLAITRTPQIRTWLTAHDPKALEQADDAIERAGYIPEHLQ